MNEILNRMRILTNTFKIDIKLAEEITNSLPGKEFNIYAQKANLEARNPVEKGVRFVERYIMRESTKSR